MSTSLRVEDTSLLIRNRNSTFYAFASDHQTFWRCNEIWTFCRSLRQRKLHHGTRAASRTPLESTEHVWIRAYPEEAKAWVITSRIFWKVFWSLWRWWITWAREFIPKCSPRTSTQASNTILQSHWKPGACHEAISRWVVRSLCCDMLSLCCSCCCSTVIVEISLQGAMIFTCSLVESNLHVWETINSVSTGTTQSLLLRYKYLLWSVLLVVVAVFKYLVFFTTWLQYNSLLSCSTIDQHLQHPFPQHTMRTLVTPSTPTQTVGIKLAFYSLLFQI